MVVIWGLNAAIIYLYFIVFQKKKISLIKILK